MCARAAAASSSCTARCAASSARTAGRCSTAAISRSASRPTTPGSRSPRTSPLGPDGDVLPESTTGFRVPACTVCGGMLKPDVVFFGEFIPAEKFREAEQLVRTQRRARDRGLVARGQLRHPAPRARTAAATARRHRQSRRDPRRRASDGQGRRGHERRAAGPRRGSPHARVAPHLRRGGLGSKGDTADPHPPRRDRLEPRPAHPGIHRHPAQRHRPCAGSGCRRRPACAARPLLDDRRAFGRVERPLART